MGLAADEFLVYQNRNQDKNRLKTVYNNNYWEGRFNLSDSKCPEKLREYKNMILKTGKYVKVINECWAKKGSKSKEIREWAPPDGIEYGSVFEEIEAYYHSSSHQLLGILVKDFKLFDHLDAVRRYLLFGDAGSDSMTHLFQIANSELFQKVDKLDLNVTFHNNKDNAKQYSKLTHLLELALRSSISRKDTIDAISGTKELSDLVKLELKETDYITENAKILSINTDLEENLKSSGKTKLKLIDVFCLDWDADWPINIVLSKNSITNYQFLFRHLLYCKIVESKLNDSWQLMKRWQAFKGNDKLWKVIFSTRLMMLSFVRNFQYYMDFEVIEPTWQKFQSNLKTVDDVDQVLDFQNTFLDSCKHDCLLSNFSLLTMMGKLLDQCLNFCSFLEKEVVETDEKGKTKLNEMSSFTCNVKLMELVKFQGGFRNDCSSLCHELVRLNSRNMENALVGLAAKINYNGFYER